MDAVQSKRFFALSARVLRVVVAMGVRTRAVQRATGTICFVIVYVRGTTGGRGGEAELIYFLVPHRDFTVIACLCFWCFATCCLLAWWRRAGWVVAFSSRLVRGTKRVRARGMDGVSCFVCLAW